MNDPLIGQMISRYQIVSLLGEGGMGSVYQGRDITLQRDVAIKLMHAQYSRQEAFQERFLQEARTAARFDHPGIVKVYDFGQYNDQLYIVMEFIPGDNLSKLLRGLRAQKSWIVMDEAVEIVRQVCLAIDYAHQRGVIHRDLKPDNIMLKPEPSDTLPFRPVVTDLGLAKLAEGGVFTQDGTSMGTPAYMSPEQAMGEKVDGRTDIYSLGVVLYELVVGKLPFPATTLTEAIRYHTKEPPPLPRSLRPDVPVPLQAVILKALEKNPANRYASAGDMAKALQAALPATKTATQMAASKGVDASSTQAMVSQVSLATRLQSSQVEERGPSVFQDFAAPSDPSQDRIQVLLPGGTTRSFQLKRPGLTIGREADNQIVLEDQLASRKHVRIDYDGQSCKIIDLGSSNGTFLGGARLLPGVAETWTPDKPLRIGKTWLQLLYGEGKARPSAAASQVRSANGTMLDPSRIHSSTGQGGIGLYLENQDFSVDPGNRTTIPMTLLNQGALVDHFKVSVEGIPAAWVANTPPDAQLLPGDKKDVSVTIQPPRAAQSRAGVYPLAVRVRSLDTPGQVAEARANLTVTPYTHFTTKLFPEKVKAGQKARLTINNQGNSATVYQLTWQDRADEIIFWPPEAKITVPNGGTTVAEFHAAPRSRPLIGGEQSRPFNVNIQAASGDPQTQQGELVSRAFIPAWLLPIMLTLMMCGLLAAGGGIAYFGGVFNPKATPVLAAATATLAPVVNNGNTNGQLPQTGPSPTPAPTNPQPTQPANQPTMPPTQTPAPKPTPVVTIAHPASGEYQPAANKDLIFQAIAYDPSVGTKDGNGIDHVDFEVLDGSNASVYKHTEKNSPYCAFSQNGNACIPYSFYTAGNSWPGGGAIASGSYTLRATAFTADGRMNTAQASLQIAVLPWLIYMNTQPGKTGIYVTNAGGSAPTSLTNSSADNPTEPLWSPNGKRILFFMGSQTSNDLYVMGIDGSNLKHVTNHLAGHLNAAWSPDNKTIAFVSNEDGPENIYTIDVNGKNQKNLTPGAGNNPKTNAPVAFYEPNWSPDGSQIVFMCDKTGVDEVYVMNADGSNMRQLTNLGGWIYRPVWSPDGSHILFSFGALPGSSGGSGVYVMTPDGGNLTNLSGVGNFNSASFTPDSKQVLYASNDPANYGIYIRNVDGSGLRQLYSGVSIDPYLSPDGKHIVFSVYDPNGQQPSQMYIMNPDGSNQVKLGDYMEILTPPWQP